MGLMGIVVICVIVAVVGGGGGGGETIGGGGGGGVVLPNGANTAAADGGSGIVIVAYTTAEFNHTGGNSTGTNGSETWVKFTSSGTLTLTAKAKGRSFAQII